jgi:hypothetical protein
MMRDMKHSVRTDKALSQNRQALLLEKGLAIFFLFFLSLLTFSFFLLPMVFVCVFKEKGNFKVYYFILFY